MHTQVLNARMPDIDDYVNVTLFNLKIYGIRLSAEKERLLNGRLFEKQYAALIQDFFIQDFELTLHISSQRNFYVCYEQN